MHGNKTEPEARSVYERQTGNSVIQFGLLTDSENIGHFLAASVDGITTDGIVVEIKCPYSRKIIQGKVPEYNQDQVQAQLEVTGLDIAHYFEYDSSTGETNLVEVRRDPDWWINNRRSLWDFWADVEATKRIHPARDSIPQSVSQQFLENTWLPLSAEAEMAAIRGDYVSQARHYLELGRRCEEQGEGYLDRALNCYITASDIAHEHGIMDVVAQALLYRSDVYCDKLGMKWYGVALGITAVNLLLGKEQKHAQNWYTIAIAQLNIAVNYANWDPVDRLTELDNEMFQGMCEMLAVFWIGRAIGIIERHNVAIEIQPEMLESYNQFGNRFGWEKLNETFSSEKFLWNATRKVSY